MSKELNNEIVDETNQAIDTDDNGTDTDTSDDKKKLDELSGVKSKLDNILDEHDIDMDDLSDFLEEGKSLKQIVGNKDAKTLKEIFDKAATLDKYEEHWKKQEQNKQHGNDDDDADPVSRLAKKLEQLEGKLTAAEQRAIDKRKQTESLETEKQVLEKFKTTVTDILNETDIPKNVRPYVEKYLGLDNPFNEIDIASKRATKKMASDGVKAYKELEKAIVQNYLEGKIKIPKVPDGSSTIPAPKDNKVKSIKDADGVIKEFIRNFKRSKA